MSETLYELIEEAKRDLLDWVRENNGDNELSDAIHEIADSAVPTYNGDLIEVFASDSSLWYYESDLAEPTTDPIKLIQLVIYESVEQALWEYWREELEDLPLCDNCSGRIVDENHKAGEDEIGLAVPAGESKADFAVADWSDLDQGFCSEKCQNEWIADHPPESGEDAAAIEGTSGGENPEPQPAA